MNLRDRLEQVAAGMPEGSSVTLPVAALRRWLEEAEEHAGPEGDRLYSVSELASRYDRSESTIRGWLNAGKLKGFKVSGSWRVSAEALREFERNDEDDGGPALGSGQEVDLGAWRRQREGEGT